MKSIGIIAEYNPFHNGHYNHIKKIKEKYKDYTIICVMSGNFTQRGEVSVIDKWKKTEIAKQAGIDLIIELPFLFATQSADFFSYGALTILEKLKVEKLIFGSESNKIEDLKFIAKTQLENEDFDHLVQIYSKFGENYPTALSKALLDLTGKKITTPNDLLGISYMKTILQNHYKIEAETIPRENNFHSKTINTISSATAIREALKNHQNIKKSIPNFVYPYLEDDLHFQEDYFPFLKYKILTTDHLENYHLVEEGIEKKLKKEIKQSSSYEEFMMRIKSKRYTYNRICRMLLYILCDIKKEDVKDMNISYIRILGFNKKGQNYLNEIKKEIDLPILSKMTKNKDPMLALELKTTDIYALTLPIEKQKSLIEKEYKYQLKGEKND